MLPLKLHNGDDYPYKILCLGAHCDDIEIGCGGVVLKLIENYKNLNFSWVVFSSDGERSREALKSANSFLHGARIKTVVIKEYKDGYFPYKGSEIKDYFESLKLDFSPDIIFTHYRNDLHQDHRVISDLTSNTFRNHFILEYEIPKYDGDLSSPNLYVNLDDATCKKKIRYIIDIYKTQKHRQWFTQELLYSILRIRGMESNSPEKYSEGFYCRKIVLEPPARGR